MDGAAASALIRLNHHRLLSFLALSPPSKRMVDLFLILFRVRVSSTTRLSQERRTTAGQKTVRKMGDKDQNCTGFTGPIISM